MTRSRPAASSPDSVSATTASTCQGRLAWHRLHQHAGRPGSIGGRTRHGARSRRQRAGSRRFRLSSRRSVWAPPVGVELAGKTLAIIGCGRIGRATARIAARGFGMIVVGYSRTAECPADDRLREGDRRLRRRGRWRALREPASSGDARRRGISSVAIGWRCSPATRGSSTRHAAPSSTKPRSMMRWRRAGSRARPSTSSNVNRTCRWTPAVISGGCRTSFSRRTSAATPPRRITPWRDARCGTSSSPRADDSARWIGLGDSPVLRAVNPVARATRPPRARRSSARRSGTRD